jgi:DNA polymerase eta
MEACDEMKLGQKASSGVDAGTEVVTIALGFSGLERGEAGQKTIEGFFGGKRKQQEGDDGSDAAQVPLQHQWRCNECQEVVSVADDSAEDLVAARLAIQIQDHKDWHMAVKLSMEDREVSLPLPALPKHISNKKPKKTKGSLDTFFQKKPTS